MKPPLSTIPAEVVSLADYEPLARERVPPDVWAYLSGGAADEITLKRNRTAFDWLRLQTRVLADLRGGDTQVTLFGRTFAHPIFLAPVASQRLFHPEGEVATARAASAMQAGLVLSTQANTRLEDVAAASSTPCWFQLYLQTNRDSTLTLVRRVEDANYAVLVVTLDAPVSGVRNREQRARFRVPDDVTPVNLDGVGFPAVLPRRPGENPLFGTGLLEAAPTWDDLAWLRSQTPLPIVLKGVIAPDDAMRAVDAGIDGLIISNHGGRTLDTLPATIEVLPVIAERLAGRLPLLLDGGIRRGTDIVKALALGASAVLVGRPYIWGLATAGTTGVAHVLHILRAELEVAMALTGRRCLREIDRSVLWEEDRD